MHPIDDVRRSVLGLALAIAAAPARAQDQAGRIVDVDLREGRASGRDLTVPARGAPTLRLRQGEAAALRWTSDRAVVLHLHGLRIEAQVEPGAPSLMAVPTRNAGRFAVETHDRAGRHTAVLYVEIHPR
ncbi:MAG: hypothetical protein JNL66_05050 [Alphaproteobacteria bacterium]|nr:hypothetical protein [Alphaproteobacteria bacterium]